MTAGVDQSFPTVQVTAGGEISIRNGRYGIDTSKAGLSLDAGTFVPNDTHASRSRHFTVITGVNGSGKSTYLKQIAIIVVLAHCGSYVPADEARIPVSHCYSNDCTCV